MTSRGAYPTDMEDALAKGIGSAYRPTNIGNWFVTRA